MQITKYEHACLVLEKQGQRVVIDPGFYTRPMSDLQGVQAIVITHMHDDHCYEEQLDRILSNNPTAKIYGTDEVCQRLSSYQTIAVHHGDFYTDGNFTLEFFGDIHAEIHRSIPLIQNCGVLVDSELYYPGIVLRHQINQLKCWPAPLLPRGLKSVKLWTSLLRSNQDVALLLTMPT